MIKIKKKVAFITPYVIPRFMGFNNSFQESVRKYFDGEYDVIFFIVKNVPVHRHHEDYTSRFNFNYKILKTKQIYLKKIELALDVPLNMFSSLVSYNPDLIIYDGFGFSYFQGYLYEVLFRKRSMMWNMHATPESIRLRKGIFYKLKCFLINRHSSVISGGDGQTEYLKTHGVSDEKIFRNDFVIDLKSFYEGVINNLNFLEREPDNDNRLNILYTGELIPRKGVINILKALVNVSFSYRLTIVGAGEEENVLRDFAEKYEINCFFKGFVSPYEISNYYAKNDVLIVSSLREAWGIVVAEGLASGLYTICSDRVGAKRMIRLGEEGEVYDCEREESLRESFENAFVSLREIRKGRNRRANVFMGRYSIAKMTKEFSEIVFSNL